MGMGRQGVTRLRDETGDPEGKSERPMPEWDDSRARGQAGCRPDGKELTL